jgi:hypothetical protein
MSNQLTFEDTFNAISSPGFPAGRSRCALPVSPLPVDCGQAPAPASHSVAPASDEARWTVGIYGLSGLDSSRSVTDSTEFQRSLESRLHRQMADCGSPEYELRWKTWPMQSGPPICALRASGRRTSGNASSGWPTTTVNDARGGRNRTSGRTNPNSQHHDGVTLCDAVGWASPSSRDWKDTPGMATTGTNPDGTERTRLDQLPRQANLAGWNSPRATDGSNGGPNQAGGALPNDASKAGWPSPMAGSPATENYNQAGNTDSTRQVETIMGLRSHPNAKKTSGLMPSGTCAETESKGAYLLNPFFSAWLQGYPKEWTFAGLKTASRSRRKSRKESHSLKATGTQSMPTSLPSS